MFSYRGRDRRGEAVRGQLEAASAEAAASQLFSLGVTPIDILPAAAAGAGAAGLDLGELWRRLQRGTVRLPDQIFFCRQMYSLLKAGVPILQALRGLEESTVNPALRRAIARMRAALDAGLDLSGAVRQQGETFSPLFVSMVQVGETTGSLPEAFQQLALYLDREKDTRDRIRQAFRYPVIVLVAIGLALAIINLFVIPAFAKVYAGFKAELPWATRILIGTSNFTVTFWPVILGALAALVGGARLYVRTGAGRLLWHRMKLRLPVVGSILYRATLGRFARALAVTYKAGVPLVSGMGVVGLAVDNAFVSGRLLAMRDRIERGETITRAATASALFPPLVLQMLSVGEETGALDTLLLEVAEYYDREVEYDVKNLSSAIEPILILAVGGMVLILALGVFLPLWDLIQVARGGK